MNNDIVFTKRGSVGHVLLNRPKALNALTLDMAIRLREQLRLWQDNDTVLAVVVEGEGEKGFCAGGDIRWLHDAGKADPAQAAEFYRQEYKTDAAIYHYPKPYIAFIDGIVMGGGVGISVHGSHRVAGDRTMFAMPETGIGLFPDVGGSYFLPRMPGQIGFFLGLTGARLKAAGCMYSGVATHYIPSDQQQAAIEALCQETTSAADVTAILSQFGGHTGKGNLARIRKDVDRIFCGADVRSILTALDQEDGNEWASKQAAILRTKSPTALRVTYQQLTRGRDMSFDEVMQMEFRMAVRVMEGHDFYEGVRATILERGSVPAWSPGRVEDVSDEMVDAYFAPLGERELRLND